jgi:uncharacterized protein DUF4124
MKRSIILLLALAIAPAALAQLYKYVDKNGKTVYSDQPPAGMDSKQLNVPTGRTTDSPAAPKSAVERDKDLDKGRKEGVEKQKRAAETADIAAQNEKYCAAARANYQTFVDGGRIGRTNEKGERVLMTDSEIDSERERARKEMEEACKS